MKDARRHAGFRDEEKMVLAKGGCMVRRRVKGKKRRQRGLAELTVDRPLTNKLEEKVRKS